MSYNDFIHNFQVFLQTKYGKTCCLKRCAMFWNNFLCSWVVLVRILVFEIWSILHSTFIVIQRLNHYETWEIFANMILTPTDTFANLIQTVTSEARVLIPKACNVLIKQVYKKKGCPTSHSEHAHQIQIFSTSTFKEIRNVKLSVLLRI